MKRFYLWKILYEAESDDSHAEFSPSASSRWINCTESHRFNKGDDPAGIEARRGSLAHGLAEFKLKNLDFDLYIIMNEIVDSFVIDEDMLFHVTNYVDLVMSYVTKKTLWAVEEKVFINDDCSGTLDFSALTGSDLHVIDLKYGQGVYVTEIDNSQLKIYAIGKLMKSAKFNRRVKNIYLHIYQPRISWAEPHRVYKIEKQELKNWAKDVLLPAIAVIKSGKNLKYCSNEAVCRWCKKKGDCSALTSHNLELAKIDFADFADENIELTPANELSDEMLSKILKSKSLFSLWMKGVEDEVFARLQAGKDIPGHKIVHATKNRVWSIPEEELVPKLTKAFKKKDLCYTKKLLSPAQAEKKITSFGFKKKILSKYIHKPQGSPILVDSSDSRPPIGGTAKEDFADLVEK